MARIRTIKPEFWTDGAIIECSTNARLLFVGTWTFADDYGNLDRSAKQLKAQVFPADNFDCEPLIQELISHDLLVEYSSNGKKYLHVQSFTKHQRVDRPGPARCPIFDESSIVPRTFVESSSSIPPRNGREGNGEVVNPPIPPQATAGKKKRVPRAPETPIPADFEVFEEMATWAKGKGLIDPQIDAETERFIAHHQAKGTRWSDWEAAWRKWILNAIKFGLEVKPPPPKPAHLRAA